jgi:uncharacterized membrane protein
VRALALVLLVGCGGPGASAADPGCEDAPAWGTFTRGFTLEYCDACHAAAAPDRHGAPEDVVFDSEDDARAWADRMVDRVDAGEMPPGGGVADADVVDLERWASCIR